MTHLQTLNIFSFIQVSELESLNDLKKCDFTLKCWEEIIEILCYQVYVTSSSTEYNKFYQHKMKAFLYVRPHCVPNFEYKNYHISSAGNEEVFLQCTCHLETFIPFCFE